MSYVRNIFLSLFIAGAFFIFIFTSVFIISELSNEQASQSCGHLEGTCEFLNCKAKNSNEFSDVRTKYYVDYLICKEGVEE